VSDRAHLVMPWHKLLDRLGEEGQGKAKIGTTNRGIGPCYADKMSRIGLRVGDLSDPALFRERVVRALSEKNRILRCLYGHPPLSAAAIVRQYLAWGRRIRPFVDDTVELLNAEVARGRRVLFEGAQGTLLDIDFGTYPFVTSSNSDACGIAAGSGVPASRVQRVLGVVKAYATRVGSGPFPTELHGPEGARLRERGSEFGATTGRPRRCGWFDVVAARHAVMVNGVDAIAVTKLDVLDDLAEIPVCVAYRVRGRRVASFPSEIKSLTEAKPILVSHPGWRTPVGGTRRYADLPAAARRYLASLTKALGVRLGMVSVGKEIGFLCRVPGFEFRVRLVSGGDAWLPRDWKALRCRAISPSSWTGTGGGRSGGGCPAGRGTRRGRGPSGRSPASAHASASAS
jgi:adenylosuccinate synthase